MSAPVESPPQTFDALPTVTRDFLPYIAPMFAYVALSSLEGYLPSPGWYPAAYAAKAAVVAAIMWYFRSTWSDLRPAPRILDVVLATAVGLVVFALWIGLDGRYPDLPFMGGARQAFDPEVLSPAGRMAFVAVRLAGLVLLVPVFEELFWRSFLIRWLIDQEFWKVPIGRVTWTAALISSGAFALAHPEWLPALLTGLIWAGLLAYSHSISACVISHVVANLALGIYVIATRSWKFW
ncbi:CAAX prenyl protease-related protein [Planctomyces sp. SH-PL62]|uniref:CAAX prenyl protease-related protein n=1 Tax=Planctomyces sp. SH-PL62 TaxID=1636152 RepID=UPI00078CBEC6|nr:CAAX prenyl protease-related protein [Planctomyces sp. SH-PL62]AMV37211.1 CAAX amino terminal protease self- immunity [Planctomyces sp. SH-PL62]